MANIVFVSPYDQFALGVRYLSSALKPHGHNSRIIALNRTHTNRNPKSLDKDGAYKGANAAISAEYSSLDRVSELPHATAAMAIAERMRYRIAGALRGILRVVVCMHEIPGFPVT